MLVQRRSITRQRALWVWPLLLLLLVAGVMACGSKEGRLLGPAEEEVASAQGLRKPVGAGSLPCEAGLQPMSPTLEIFAVDSQGNAWGAQSRSLYRMGEGGRNAEKVRDFTDPVQGIHFTNNGTLFVSTDADRWNSQKPCRLYRSTDGGRSFVLIRTLRESCALWWSMAHDSRDNFYVGEYGPRGPGQSKRVWKTADYGRSWKLVFQAPDHSGLHIHRVAVDPYTDDVWVTHGDGAFQGMYHSQDQGVTWVKVREAQPTAVAFTRNAIYWGEDTSEGRVTCYDRLTQLFTTVLDASLLGPYGGSVYDMAVSRQGMIYLPMVKYIEQSHKPTLWMGDGKTWKLIVAIEGKEGKAGGFLQISPPDKQGYLYASGNRIVENCHEPF